MSWEGCEDYDECKLALELNKHQVLFECGHRRYWYLGDRVLLQVLHVYSPEVNPVNPCPPIWLANLLTDDEVANERVSHTNHGIPRDYLEFVKVHLQGHFGDASKASVGFLFSRINLFHLCHFGSFGKVSDCFILQALSYGAGNPSQGRTNPPPPSNVGGPHVSFVETYPNFLAWRYKIMNPNGSYSFMNLDQPKYAQNVPWNGSVYSQTLLIFYLILFILLVVSKFGSYVQIGVEFVEESKRMIGSLKRVTHTQSS